MSEEDEERSTRRDKERMRGVIIFLSPFLLWTVGRNIVNGVSLQSNSLIAGAASSVPGKLVGTYGFFSFFIDSFLGGDNATIETRDHI